VASAPLSRVLALRQRCLSGPAEQMHNAWDPVGMGMETRKPAVSSPKALPGRSYRTVRKANKSRWLRQASREHALDCASVRGAGSRTGVLRVVSVCCEPSVRRHYCANSVQSGSRRRAWIGKRGPGSVRASRNTTLRFTLFAGAALRCAKGPLRSRRLCQATHTIRGPEARGGRGANLCVNFGIRDSLPASLVEDDDVLATSSGVAVRPGAPLSCPGPEKCKCNGFGLIVWSGFRSAVFLA
jgi:hypothetical protein